MKVDWADCRLVCCSWRCDSSFYCDRWGLVLRVGCLWPYLGFHPGFPFWRLGAFLHMDAFRSFKKKININSTLDFQVSTDWLYHFKGVNGNGGAWQGAVNRSPYRGIPTSFTSWMALQCPRHPCMHEWDGMGRKMDRWQPGRTWAPTA